MSGDNSISNDNTGGPRSLNGGPVNEPLPEAWGAWARGRGAAAAAGAAGARASGRCATLRGVGRRRRTGTHPGTDMGTGGTTTARTSLTWGRGRQRLLVSGAILAARSTTRYDSATVAFLDMLPSIFRLPPWTELRAMKQAAMGGEGDTESDDDMAD
ncbi:hypothetical protein DFH09DRAFT_1470664 [Mycena vulgaris]|nr:hypothetical protein DFH09DRAFT_1470664 [Mycena vulgaris]